MGCLRSIIWKIYIENNIEINRNNAPVHDNFPISMNENVPNLEGNHVDIRQFHEITAIRFKNILFRSCLALSAKLYNDITLNRTQVQNIIDHIITFISNGFLELLKDKTLTILTDNNISQDEIENLDAMFAAMHNMFLGLETETQRVKALEGSYCYIAPKSYIISMDEKMKKIRGNLVLTPVELTGQFISLSLSLYETYIKIFFRIAWCISCYNE